MSGAEEEESGGEAPEAKAGGQRAATVVGPARLTLDTVSTFGPFAGAGRTSGRASGRFFLTNLSSKPIGRVAAYAEPLRAASSGAAAPHSFVISCADQIPPNGSGEVDFAVTAPARPGVYETNFRAAFEGGPSVTVPVVVNVAARSFWGVACLLVGLAVAGLLGLLDDQKGVKGQLARALAARDSELAELQDDLPSERFAGDLKRVEREMDEAVSALNAPRALSFVDHRIEDSQAHLASAKAIAKAIRERLPKDVGSARGKDLTDALKEFDAEISVLTATFPAGAKGGTSFADRVGQLNAWAAGRLLHAPAKFVSADLSFESARVRLLYSAGRSEDGAQRSAFVARWIQRAADHFRKMSELLTFFAQTTLLAVSEEQRYRAEAMQLAPEARDAILAKLDALLSTSKGPASWPDFLEISRSIYHVHTDLLRAQAEAVKAAAEAARQAEDQQDSVAKIEAVFAEGKTLPKGADGKAVPEEKARWIGRVLDAWGERLDTSPDPPPQSLREALATARTAAATNDLDSLSAQIRALGHGWAVFTGQRAQTMILDATKPFCLTLRNDADIELASAREEARQLQASVKLQDWEERLDVLGARIARTPDTAQAMSQTCFEELYALSNDVQDLQNEVTSASWSAATLPDATGRALVADVGALLTPEAVATLIRDVRPLEIAAATAAADRYVDRDVVFAIHNLAAQWGPGFIATIDFGDGVKETRDGEHLQTPALSHRYRDAKTFDVSIAVREGRTANARLVGEGRLRALTILPSPITSARSLADAYFNLRFALSLLLASALYFWRSIARAAVFGARNYDYAESFLIGFAASVAVNQLPETLAKLVEGKL